MSNSPTRPGRAQRGIQHAQPQSAMLHKRRCGSAEARHTRGSASPAERCYFPCCCRPRALRSLETAAVCQGHSSAACLPRDGCSVRGSCGRLAWHPAARQQRQGETPSSPWVASLFRVYASPLRGPPEAPPAPPAPAQATVNEFQAPCGQQSTIRVVASANSLWDEHAVMAAAPGPLHNTAASHPSGSADC
jgi:hypothetical protein